MTDRDDWIALTEHVTDWRTDDLAVRLDERLVLHVLLSGPTSKNGHRYADAALREAAALYDRKPVFLDHAANLAKPYDRSTRDLAGWIAEARYVGGRIVGDIRVLETDAGRTLLALMSSETPAIGMSHVILARRSADGTVVERIHDVISVDAVVFPATTSGFREESSDGELAGEAEAARRDAERNLAAIREELARVVAERDELQRRCRELEAAALEQEIEHQWTAADLPMECLTPTLRSQLRSASDASARSRLIEEQRQLFRYYRQRAPCSRGRSSADDRDASLLRQIVQAVKHRR